MQIIKISKGGLEKITSCICGGPVSSQDPS